MAGKKKAEEQEQRSLEENFSKLEAFKRRAIDRWEGAIFLAIYVAYIGYLIR